MPKTIHLLYLYTETKLKSKSLAPISENIMSSLVILVHSIFLNRHMTTTNFNYQSYMKSRLNTTLSWQLKPKSLAPTSKNIKIALLFLLQTSTAKKTIHTKTQKQKAHIFNQKIKKSRTCWKLLTVLPILRPTSGSCFGPKTRAETPTITTISGTPSPKMQLQENRRFWALMGRSRESPRPARFLML